MQSTIKLPRRTRGRQTAAAQRAFATDLEAFCDAVLEIRSRLDFEVSARGWCYILEEHGLGKGEFDAAERLICDCRKRGFLPLSIVAEDGARAFDHLERLDENDPEAETAAIVDSVGWQHLTYTPISFWDDQEHYVEMLVEKVDLKSLFSRVCAAFRIPIANARGWSDLNSRAAMMRRFGTWEAQGKSCVLLYCGDHDPVGLNMSAALRANMDEIADAVGWSPHNLIIDRFGLNADFITSEGLSWIDSLETGSGRDLADPRHPDHSKPYVQAYLRRFGARKCEANALVVRPDAGRQLCRQAILSYLSDDAPDDYTARLSPVREQVRAEVTRLMMEGRA